MKFYSLVLVLICLLSSCVNNMQKDTSEENKELLPGTWGAKQIFAYSGLDGQTDFNKPFTGIVLANRLGIRIGNHDHYLSNLTPEQFIKARPLWFELLIDDKVYSTIKNEGDNNFDSLDCTVVASNVIDVTAFAEGVALNFKLVHANARRFVGNIQLKSDTKKTVKLHIVHPFSTQGEWMKNRLVHADENYYTALSLHGGDWNYNNNSITSEKLQLEKNKPVEFGCDFSINYSEEPAFYVWNRTWFDTTVEREKQVYRDVNVDWIPDMQLGETYLKAYSVMRGNTETAQGMIDFMWTTPDRTPHKKMWLWDSGFHAIGLRHFNMDWAEKALKAILSVQHDDGFITISTTPYKDSDITQPPVLAFAVWKVFEKGGNVELLEYSYPRLIAYLKWNYENRDHDKNGLMEWESGDESGMDNSPRFDKRKYMDAVDFNCFVANEWYYLEKIAEVLGKTEDEAFFLKQRRDIINKINTLLWNPDTQMYYDRYIETGELSDVEAISSFLPLFAKVATEQQANALIREYTDNEKWWTPLPCPSISKTHESFGSNMWRGPVWINYCYLMYEGLKNYGEEEAAKELAEATIQQISYWYHKEGTIFEFFDPMAKISPQKLPRKKSFGCIHEFGWSCTLYMEMLNDLYGQKEE